MSDLHSEVRDCCGDIPLDEMCGKCFQIQSSINDRDIEIIKLRTEVAALKAKLASIGWMPCMNVPRTPRRRLLR